MSTTTTTTSVSSAYGGHDDDDLEEFVVGLEPTPMPLAKSALVKEMVLITEPVHRWTLVAAPNHRDGGEDLVAVVINGGSAEIRVRDEADEDEDEDGVTVSHAVLGDVPTLDGITLQTTVTRVGPDRACWRRVSYLELSLNDGNGAVVGRLRSPSESTEDVRYLPPVEVDGPCAIVGVGSDHADLCCLQVVRGRGARTRPREWWGRTSGTVSVRDPASLRAINAHEFVATERRPDDPDGPHRVMEELSHTMRHWYKSRTAVDRARPRLNALVDESLSDSSGRDDVVSATLRLERHLRWRARRKCRSHRLDRDPFLRLKLLRVWRAPARALAQSRNATTNRPRPNCYTVAYLYGTVAHRAVAYVVGVSQIALTAILARVMADDRGRVDSVVDCWTTGAEGRVLRPVVLFYSVALFVKRHCREAAVNEAYPGFVLSRVGVLHHLVNGFALLALLVLLHRLVVDTDDALRALLLPSLATALVREMDTYAVFLEDADLRDLDRRLSLAILEVCLRDVDPLYFQYQNWDEAKNHCVVNDEKCRLERLPETPTEKIDTNVNSEYSAVAPSSSVLLSWENPLTFDASRDKGWCVVRRSAPLDQLTDAAVSCARLFFRWRATGGGDDDVDADSYAGCLRVTLRDADDEVVASTHVYGVRRTDDDDDPSSRRGEEVSETYPATHGLVRKAADGRAYRYAVEILVADGARERRGSTTSMRRSSTVGSLSSLAERSATVSPPTADPFRLLVRDFSFVVDHARPSPPTPLESGTTPKSSGHGAGFGDGPASRDRARKRGRDAREGALRRTVSKPADHHDDDDGRAALSNGNGHHHHGPTATNAKGFGDGVERRGDETVVEENDDDDGGRTELSNGIHHREPPREHFGTGVERSVVVDDDDHGRSKLWNRGPSPNGFGSGIEHRQWC